MENLSEKLDLSRVSKELRLFITMFLIVMGIGYLLAVINIQVLEGMTIDGVGDHYHGNEAKGIYAPEPAELLSESHTHALGMGTMFFSMGLIFLFTRTLPGWLKKFVLVDSFAAILIAVSSFWLIKYVAKEFAWLMMLSGMMLGFCAFFEIMVPLYEMWIKDKEFFKKKVKTLE